MNQGISIIVPTYKEIGNLPRLIERIAALKSKINPLELIFVDDNSQDGTEEYLTEQQQKNDWIKFISRKKQRGLSTAVIEGFNHARYPILVCMDADLSHPPEAIPQLIQAISVPNVDFVIGSRFTKGGSIYNAWSIIRWSIASTAKLIAKIFTTANDPMSGFFCLKKSTFAHADKLNPIGYKIGLELIVKCHCKNIVEIPIHFGKRFKGESKLNFKEIINYLRHVSRLLVYKLTTNSNSHFGCHPAAKPRDDSVSSHRANQNENCRTSKDRD